MSGAVTPAAVGALLAGGRAGEALALAREAVRQRPRDPGWLHLLAVALHAKGASDEPIATLDQALAIAPSDAVALNTRGAIQIERGDLAAAENSLREALKIRGDYAEARFNLALALRRRGELESAEAELDRILGSPYPLDAARLERATLHIERGDAG